MTTTAIRQKLYDFIRISEDRKVKALYTMFENEIEEKEYDYWKDNLFIAELDNRSNNYKKRIIKGIAWDEAKPKILSSAKSISK